MTNPFSSLSSGGAYFKPADHAAHLVVVANVKAPFGRKFDDMRKAEVDVATFDFADLADGQGWQVGINSSHAGITNKLTGIAGQPGAMVLGKVGQVQTSGGFLAWTLAEVTDPAEVQAAAQWVQANPAPLVASPFAAPAPVAAAPVVAPVVTAQAPAQPQQDVAALLASLQQG